MSIRGGDVRKRYAGAKTRAEAIVKSALTADERRFAAALRKAESDEARAALLARWSPWEGTPETNEKIAQVPSHRREWPLDRMARLGKITADELAAGAEIASVIEMIKRAGSVGAASLEARVDYASSARDTLVESLGRVRLERAYSAWRQAIPQPRAMIIDMLTTNMSYVKLAAIYELHWKTARRLLITALRMWDRHKIEARTSIGREDVEEIYAHLGEGTLLAPKPKLDQPAANISEDEAR